jgi:chromate transporter
MAHQVPRPQEAAPPTPGSVGGPPLPTSTPVAGRPEAAVPLGTAVRVWFGISLQTFGGPAGQIAVMQRTLVEERRWIGQRRFLHALNYCTLLPGPEAQQLATYVGWLLHGTRRRSRRAPSSRRPSYAWARRR